MESFSLTYYDPEINLDGYSRGIGRIQTVHIAPIREHLDVLLRTYSENLAPFEFSFFDAFGIPPYSHISTEHHFGAKWTPGLKQFIVNAFFLPFLPLFKNPNIITSQRSNYIEFNYNETQPKFVGSETNKIHLMVKHEYILYTILKLASLPTYFPANKFVFKFQLFNRTSNLRPENTGLYDIRMDGGVAPTVVIYGSSDSVTMSLLLSLVLNLFPEHDRIGLMEESGTRTLSPFNIRLNKLVSYAAGDRGKSLDAMLRNMGNIRLYSDYSIPRWLEDLQGGCNAETREGLNRQTQLFLGIDACDESGAAIDYAEKCKEERTPDMKYCYITKSPEMLDPRKLVGGRRRTLRRSNRKRQSRRTRGR